MTTFFLFGSLITGFCLGSFLNVLIYRIPRNLGFIKGRSFCPQCKKNIFWFDNIPLVSYLLLGGRCRFCKKPISVRYPLVETVSAVLFVLVTSSNLSSLSFLSILSWIANLILVSGLIVIFFIDLEHQIIPDEIIFPLIGLFLVEFLANLLVFPLATNYLLLTTYSPLFSAAGSFLFFYFIYLFTKKKGMGFGDVKLALLMGLVLGFPKVLLAFYIAFLTGAVAGSILVLRKKAKLKGKIAFGPFLSLATVSVLIWGDKILELVAKFFF